MKKKLLVNFFATVLIFTIFATIPMVAYADDDPSQTEVSPTETTSEPTETEGDTNVGILIVADDPNVGITTVGDNANIDVSTSGDANVMINGEHVQQNITNTTVYKGVGVITVREEIDAKLFALIYPRLDLSEATFGQLLPLVGSLAEFYEKYGSSVNMISVLVDNTEAIAAIKDNNKELEALILNNQNEITLLKSNLESTSDELKIFKTFVYVGMALIFLLFICLIFKNSSSLEKTQKPK